MHAPVRILFSSTHQYLGELFLEDGKFSHLTLTPSGEALMGEIFEEWQVRGIPAVHDIVQAKHESVSYTHDGRVLLRESGFVKALEDWTAAHGYLMLPMGLEALDCWENVLQLPLEPDEVFALAEDLSLVPLEEIGAWKRTLQDAVKASESATI